MAEQVLSHEADAAPKTGAASAVQANPHHAKRWWILAVLGLAQVMVILDTTVVNIALPTAQRDLGFSNGNRQWIITAYALAFGSLLLLGGRLADLLGHKRTFIVGLIGFGVASAIGGAANGFGMLVVARTAQGAFGALMAPAGLALMTTTFTDAKERAKAFGIYGAIAGAGGGLGLLLGGLLTEYTSWRWTLFINLAIAGVALIGTFVFLHHQKSPHHARLDLPGTLTVTAGLFALVYGFSRAESHGWSNTGTIGFLIAAGVLLVAFVLIQRRSGNPLLPLHVLLDRNRAGAFLSIFLVSIGMFAVFLFLTYYLQVNKGYSAVRSGVAFLPMIGVLSVTAAVVNTRLATKVSPRITVPVGLALGAVGMYLLTRLNLSSSYVDVLIPLVVMGAGFGITFASAPSNATLGVEPEDAGVASAVFNVMQQVGGSVGTALLNTIAASAATSYLTSHAGQVGVQGLAVMHSYTTAFWWAAGIIAGAAVLTAIIFRSGVPQLDPDAAPVSVG